MTQRYEQLFKKTNQICFFIQINAVSHVNTMRKIERGDENVQLDILIKVCDFLDYKLKLKLVKK